MTTTLPIVRMQAAAPDLPAPKIMPGAGTRLTANTIGYAVSVDPGRQSYRHPFKPTLGGFKVRISRGLIDEEFEPKIGGVPIGGAQGKPQPFLKLDFAVANAQGVSWVCVEAEPNANGKIDSKSRVEIVHTNKPKSLDPKVGRKALCQIIWRNGRPWTAHEIVYFNLNYVRVQPAPGGGAVRHYFL